MVVRTTIRQCVQLAFSLLANASSQSLDSCLVGTGDGVFILFDTLSDLASEHKQTNKQKTNYDLFSSLKAIALFFMKTKSNDNMEFMEFRLSFSLFLSSLALGNKGGKTGF